MRQVDQNSLSSGAVLIVEDEPVLCQTLVRILEAAGIEAVGVADGPAAFSQLDENSFDMMYLDIHLPGMNGLEILKQVQDQDLQVPVILLTAHATLQTALEALRLGAADYLVKPLNPQAVVSRTRVLLAEQARLRRERHILAEIDDLQAELRQLRSASPGARVEASFAGTPEERFLSRGQLIIDLQARAVTFGSQVLSLPPTAFDYLVVLAQRSPGVVAYQDLVAAAQGFQADRREAIELNKYHIHVLRDALEPDPRKPQHILNVRGVGYRLSVDA